MERNQQEKNLDPLAKTQIGQTDVEVSRIGLGGAFFSASESRDAIATIDTALDLGISYLDTAPLYGRGRSETYLGEVLPKRARDSFVLSTKVGRYLVQTSEEPPEIVFDYTAGGTQRSIEESLERLGIDRIDILLIHDIDQSGRPFEEAVEGAAKVLADLKRQGLIRAWGTGLNQPDETIYMLQNAEPDVCLLAGRYTLLDQSAIHEALPLMTRKGVSMVLGGPYNSGVLASSLGENEKFDYVQASPAVLEKARQIKGICDRYDVSMKAATLQFSLAHPQIAAVIPGAKTPDEVAENINLLRADIPLGLWDELTTSGLIVEGCPTPNA